MKRKRFIQTLGVGALALYTVGLEACSKSDPESEPSTNIDGKTSSGGGKEIILTNSAVKDGYTDKLSYNPGENMKVFINGRSEEQVNIGLYTPTGVLRSYLSCGLKSQSPGQQPYKNGFGYALSFSFIIPDNLESGLYYWAKTIPFIVKNNKKDSSIVVVLPSNTDNAYNKSGGQSSYTTPMSPILSYQRPYDLARWHEEFWPWAEKLNYKMDYIVDQDLDDEINFSYAKLIILPGHSEYWTRKARVNFDQFIDSGKNALILSGNTMWWQIRYSDDKNQMICYKVYENDPAADYSLKTDLWTTTSLKYPIEKSIGMNFNLGGYGDESPNSMKGYKIVNESSPLLLGTGLKNGDLISCPTQEYDGAFVKYVNGNPHPILDNKLNFHKIELVGYDFGTRINNNKTVGTFIALQKAKTSGVIVNTASIDWCSKRGMGGKDGAIIKRITTNAIDLLLSGALVFAT